MTGIVDQYLQLSEETDADIVAMQVGDFYEFFAEGARTVAEELDLKVSEKSAHGSTYPMAGVPVSELTPYLKALVERGYRVAVADQREEGDDITREVTRVVTPGTLLDATDATARYLGSVVRAEGEYGLAFADVTTGRFRAGSVADADAALTELYRFAPVEVLLGPDLRESGFAERVASRTDAELTDHSKDAFAPGAAAHTLREQFGRGAVESVGLDGAAVRAAGAVLAYVEATGAGVLASLTRLQSLAPETGVALDATTQRNLELVEPMTRGGTALVEVLDHTETSAGGRLLREWLTRPRRDREELARRAAAVEALSGSALARESMRDTLSEAYDLERLAGRAAAGRADATDLARIRETLALVPDLREAVNGAPGLSESPLRDLLDGAASDALADLRTTLEEALVEDPPGTVTEGGMFRRGYDDDLDALIDDHETALEWVENLAERERERHGITHLQVDRNRTDGYYVQVGRSETDGVPDSYREIKTLKNSKRYTTEALQEREREILRLEEKRGELERRLFEELRERVGERADALQRAGRALAELDTLASFATHAVENGWTRPDIGGEGIDVRAGRHPVVEQTTEFVPNDLHLDADRRFLLVTGPNMSGKSTYMRQAALVTLLAQVGSFVPADAARVEAVDGVYTRVGALDELAGGRSTFMVEMEELSNILHSASEDSLVILDEVGRGTATYDGISIAWAATEYLHNEVGAYTLFATHYHELTALANHLERVANVHVAVDGEPESPSASETSSRPDDDRPEASDGVTFLRTVREGATDRSYGIHVADLAGVPEPVVDRSRDVLERLREEKAVEARGSGGGEPVQAVFDLGSGTFAADGSAERDGSDAALDPEAEAVLAELRETDVNGTTPIDLLSKVREWQSRLE